MITHLNIYKKLSILLSILILSACSFVSYYDSVSYKNLTDLKGEMKVFFDACATAGASGEEAQASVDSFVIKSSKAYEYEKGKDLNDDTIAQLGIINDTVSDVGFRYDSNIMSGTSCDVRNGDEGPGCLTTGYCKGKWLVLETAFDIAISTEALKLKEK